MKKYLSLIIVLIFIACMIPAAMADVGNPVSVTVVANPVGGGSFTVGGVALSSGESAGTLVGNNIVAIANTGWSFSGWADGESSSTRPASDGDATYTANFTHTEHSYTWETTTPATKTAKGEKTGTCSVCGATKTEDIPALGCVITTSSSPTAGGTTTGGGTYNKEITVYATPSTGYKFVNWTVGGSPVSTNTAYTFTPTDDTDLVANFVIEPAPVTDTYQVTYLDDNGNILATATENVNNSIYISGARCYREGYSQYAWSTTKDSSGTEYAFGSVYRGAKDSNLQLYPKWVKGPSPVGTYTLSFSAGSTGASGSAASQSFNYGQTVAFPGVSFYKTGFTQIGWSTDPNGTTCSYPLNGTAVLFNNLTLYPCFSQTTGNKTVYVDYSDYGTVYWGNTKINRGTTLSLSPGQSLTLSFSPVNEYYVYNVNVNGYNLGSRSSYTFNYADMAGNKSIYVRFGSVYGSPKTGDDSNPGLWIALGLSAAAAAGATVIAARKKEQ